MFRNNNEIGHESYKALGYLQPENQWDMDVAPSSILDSGKVTDKMLIDWCNRMSEEIDQEKYYFGMDLSFSDNHPWLSVYFRQETDTKIIQFFDFKNGFIDQKKSLGRDDEAIFRELEQDILNGKYK
jgi:hypothetical protein